MAKTKSALKRIKQSLKRRQRNRRVKSHIKNAVKAFYASLQEKDLQKARETLAAAGRVIDKAASKGVIHKKKAARKKSRLAKQLNRLVS